jgi:hypothetical protein
MNFICNFRFLNRKIVTNEKIGINAKANAKKSSITNETAAISLTNARINSI